MYSNYIANHYINNEFYSISVFATFTTISTSSINTLSAEPCEMNFTEIS